MDDQRRPARLRYHATGGARPMPAGRVAQVGLVAFLVAGLLNADSLYGQANRQPFGWKRDVARAAVWPFRTVSHATGLDEPRRAIQEAIGRDEPVAEDARRSGISRAPSADLSAQPPGFELRRPTAEEPLRVWAGGDSMAQVYGQSVVADCEERGTLDCTLDYRISTGLTRPDFFDWPAHLADEVLPSGPEVMIIMFGANDAQGMELASGVHQVRDQQWQDEYRKRVGETMDLLAGDGRLVIWVGQPAMKKADFDERMNILNVIYAEQAKSRPWVRFLDSRAVLSTDGGSYQAYLPDGSGEDELARNPDGIHLTRFGGDRLSAATLDLLDQAIAEGRSGGAPAGAPSADPQDAASGD
jgi:hypothetical protein